jgi:poly-gamma-glutamate synthesis protein (capsule biosynthesis protein)
MFKEHTVRIALVVAAVCLLLGAAGILLKLPARKEGGIVPVGASAPAEPASASVIFGGDMMFDRYIRTVAETKGGAYLFSCISPLLHSADLVVANLEGPVTASSSVSVGSTPGGPNNMTFTFPTTVPALLFSENIRAVNIGNNHIMNFSRPGLESTKAFLSAAGVSYFGDPDAAEEDRVLRTSVNGIPVSFVNWSDWTSDKTDHTVAQVREEKSRGGVVFVYTHWGIEYATTSPARVRALAHEFIDAGADMVIGSHPHVVEEHELYRGKDIYYSLGNFIFDQYWNAAVSHGLLLEVSFTKEGVSSVKEIPVELDGDGRTCLAAAS